MKIGLIGNPNVGKSTIFNNLTGMHQHTGNWHGKTVAKASGHRNYKGIDYLFEDLPGTYSLFAHSNEQEITRNFIYNEDYDALIVVCDAVCLERSINLILQILEITNKVVVCVNLMDEAKKKKIQIDISKLSEILGVPVVATVAKNKECIEIIMEKLSNVVKKENGFLHIDYDEYLTSAIDELKIFVDNKVVNKNVVCLNWLSSKVNSSDKIFLNKLSSVKKDLYKKGIKSEDIDVLRLERISTYANSIASKTVKFTNKDYNKKDRMIDKIVTHKIFSIPLMLMLLLIVFWITIIGANYPSEILYDLFFRFENVLLNFFDFIKVPDYISNLLVYGVYRVVSWVVSVMLPPMAIFFPLFTLLEDLGYLPRIAFCLDGVFKKCSSCGKQALTMIMGFGCNAVGVTGARIIDSKRERLMAILTNCFVPCNGRFPLLICMITMFLIVDGNSFLSSFVLTIFIVISILMTFLVTKLLSKTLLKGVSSSITLELPPYRRPQVIKVIIRSVFDKTIFVLKRAIIASVPAGVIIWLMANINIGNISVLENLSNLLDPFAKTMGLDGVILFAFILAFPANEIVIPIIIMGYMSLGHLTEINDLSVLKELFIQNDWTILTAICVVLFSLCHWPCLTTVLTIKKETGSMKWAFLSVVIPTIIGIILCMLTTCVYNFVF